MKAMKMGLEGLLIQNSALTIPSVTRTFTGKNMLWPITYIFCLVKDWEFCKLFTGLVFSVVLKLKLPKVGAFLFF